jgi:hypothetical protein
VTFNPVIDGRPTNPVTNSPAELAVIAVTELVTLGLAVPNWVAHRSGGSQATRLAVTPNRITARRIIGASPATITGRILLANMLPPNGSFLKTTIFA